MKTMIKNRIFLQMNRLDAMFNIPVEKLKKVKTSVENLVGRQKFFSISLTEILENWIFTQKKFEEMDWVNFEKVWFM